MFFKAKESQLFDQVTLMLNEKDKKAQKGVDYIRDSNGLCYSKQQFTLATYLTV